MTTPDRITVDHILIAVKSPRMPDGQAPEAAKALADDILKQLEAGADWADLKPKYSADPAPGGPYALANHDVTPGSGEYPRAGMVPAFGDVGFGLEIGEIGIAAYDPEASPFGYHLIKRVK